MTLTAMDRLHAGLADDSALAARLRRLAEDAPASAPLSLCIPLGSGHEDWLAQLPNALPFWYAANPATSSYRLGLDHAFHWITSGAHRFSTLDTSYSGLLRHWRHEAGGLAFCGFAFDEATTAPLPNALLALPAILLENCEGRCRAVLTTPAASIDAAPARWRQLLQPSPTISEQPPRRPAASTLAERAWIARVKAALAEIENTPCEKLVLSRSMRLTLAAPLALRPVLARLLAQQPESLIYAHGDGKRCFFGATPETLASRRQQRLETEALAGTAWPGSPALSDPKNRHEQSLVVRAVLDALAPLCLAPPVAHPAESRAAGRISHLHSRICGALKPDHSLLDVVRALHPTPAVGGYPTAAALDWLARHGERRAAWYSGGFGLLDHHGNGEFRVALRSALLDGQYIELQAGAGIVAGSDPMRELAETEAKFATLLAALLPEQNDAEIGVA